MSMTATSPARSPRLLARWELLATLELTTAAHLGAGIAHENVDMPLLRDTRSGRALLTGSETAGALRSFLLDRLGFGERSEPTVAKRNEWQDEERRLLTRVTDLFGGAPGDDDGSQSPLIVDDALSALASPAIEIRDGVGLDPAWGVARDRCKYDFEVLPKGTTFPLKFELLVDDTADEHELVGTLLAALEGLQGTIALGARTSRGLGRCRAQAWQVRRWDLNDEAEWRSWLLDRPASNGRSCATPLEAAKQHLPDIAEAIPAAARQNNWRATLHLHLKPGQGMLIRSPGLDPGDADVGHLHSGGQPTVTGTGVAGPLRARAWQIARLFIDERETKTLIDDLFGPELPGKNGAGDERKAVAARGSRLVVSESYIEGGVFAPKNPVVRNKLDRFTQAVVDGALFEEAPLEGGRFILQLDLWPNQEDGQRQVGLWLLLLRDLIRGRLAIGGTSAIARGYVTGEASIWPPDGESFQFPGQWQRGQEYVVALTGKPAT